MAFIVTPDNFDVGVLEAGDEVLIPVVFSGLAGGVVGSGVVTFTSAGETGTVTTTVSIGVSDVEVQSIVLDPDVVGIEITVVDLTNEGATVRVARAP